MTQSPDIHAPWTLHFDRDGTEDFGVIQDADGDEIVTSSHFWLPETKGEPVPHAAACLYLMAAAPKLLAALQGVLEDRNCTIDYERRLLINEAIASARFPVEDLPEDGEPGGIAF